MAMRWSIVIAVLVLTATPLCAYAQKEPVDKSEPESTVIEDKAGQSEDVAPEEEAVEPEDVALEEDIGEDTSVVGSTVHEEGGLVGAGLVLGVKLGGGFGQIFSDLGASFVVELELGYCLPLPQPIGRDLQLFVTGQYAGPSMEDTVSATDARLPGDGTWQYELTLQQVIITFGLLYRIPIPLDWLRPYVAGGGRAYLTRTEVTGQADGQPYGDNEETATEWGGFGAIGADFFVGPGAILFEVQVGFAPVDRFVLQNTSAGSMNVVLGYRLFI